MAFAADEVSDQESTGQEKRGACNTKKWQDDQAGVGAVNGLLASLSLDGSNKIMTVIVE